MKKIIIFIGMCMILSYSVMSALSDNLVSYYSFDDADLYDSDGNISDLHGDNDGDIQGALATGESCALNECFLYAGNQAGGDYVTVTVFDELDFGDYLVNWTINCWIDPDEYSGAIFGIRNGGTEIQWWYTNGQDDLVSYNGDGNVQSTTSAPGGSWSMVTFTKNGTLPSYEYYINAYTAGSGNQTRGTTQSAITAKFGWSGYTGDDEYFGGHIDECGIWSRRLTEAELILLNNSGTPLSYTEILAGAPGTTPTLTLSSDINSYTNWTTNPFMFNISSSTVNVSIDEFNCTLSLNNTINQTLTNVTLNGTTIGYNLTYGDEEVGYDINVSCFKWEDSVYVIDEEILTDIFIDSVIPSLSQDWITNNTVYYHNINELFNITGSCSDTNLLSCNYTLYEINTTDDSRLSIINSNYNTSITTPTYNITVLVDLNNLSNGRYEFFGEAWDDHNPIEKPHETFNSFSTDTDSYRVEFDGGFFNIYDTNIDEIEFEDSDNKYKEKFKFDDYSGTMIITSDTPLQIRNTEHKAHIVSRLMGKYKDLDHPDFYVDDITVISDYEIHIDYHVTSLELETESIGDLNQFTSSWFFNVTDGYSFTATDGIDSSSILSFTVNIFNSSGLILSGSTTTGNLTFNLTSGTYNTNISGSDYANNETSPLIFSSGGSFEYTLYRENSLYLFFYDEDTDLLIDDRNVTITVINLDANSSLNTTDTGSIFISGFSTGEFELQYSAPGYRSNSYFTTISDSSTQTLDLYLVPNSTSSLIVFNLVDERGNPIYDATLKRQRYMINDNAYILTGMSKTDSNGETSMYLVPNDVFYIFVVDYSGSTIFTGSQQKVFSSTVYLRIPIDEDELESLENILTVTESSLWFDNSTKLIYYYWNDPDNLVIQGCLELKKEDILGTTTLETTCTASASATLTINVTPYLVNDTMYNAYGYLETNTTNSNYLTDSLLDFLRYNKSWERFGNVGLFLGYIMIGTMFFLGLPFNFTIALVYSVLAMIGLQAIGISFFGYAFIMTVTILGFIVAVVNRI